MVEWLIHGIERNITYIRGFEQQKEVMKKTLFLKIGKLNFFISKK